VYKECHNLTYRPLSDVVVDTWLEEKYPERFPVVRADLDQQIAALSVKTVA
jgi:hypothetical protein